MAELKMTRKEFFTEFKNAAKNDGGPYASKFLEIASAFTDEDFVNGNEVITVDSDEISFRGGKAGRGNGLDENEYLVSLFGLKKESEAKLVNLGYQNVRNGLGSFVVMTTSEIYDRFEDISKVNGQTEFVRNDKAYELHGWLRDAFEEVDDLGESKYGTELTFYERTKNGERKLNAEKISEAFSSGRIVYAHHPDYGVIPFAKTSEGKAVSGDRLLNIPKFVPEKTEIPKVKGIWNNICRFFHIETSGNREYFEAKRLEKARRIEADAKNAELEKAKETIKSNPHFLTKITLKIDEERQINIEKEKSLPITEKRQEKVYAWKDELEEEVNNKLGDEEGELRVYSDKLDRLNFGEADNLLKKGKTLYASSTSANKAFKFNLLGKDGTLLFGDSAAEAEKRRDIRFALNDMVGSYDTLFEMAHGNARMKDGENERMWMDKAYINLRTNRNYKISSLSDEEREKVVESLNDWINKNRSGIISNFKAHANILKKDISEDTLDYLNKLDGNNLLSVLETKQEENKARYKTSKIENTARRIEEAAKKAENEAPEADEPVSSLNSKPEKAEEIKEEKVREDEKSLKGQEIIDGERKKAYSVLMDTSSTPSEIADSIATIMVCHTLSAKSGLEADIISRKNGGADTLLEIDAEKSQNIKTRARISDKPELIKDTVNKLKETPAFGYFASELEGVKKSEAENEASRSAFFTEQRGKLAVRGFKEQVPLGDPAPVKAESMAYESLLIKTFNEKNASLTSASVSEVLEEVKVKEFGKELSGN